MTHVTACIDQSRAALAVCDYAIWSSLRMQAPLTFLHVLDHQQYPAPMDFSGSIGLGTREQLLEELAVLDEARGKLGREHGQHLLDSAKQRARDAGIEKPHCCQRHGDLIDTVKEMEDKCRLLILGRQGEGTEKGVRHAGSPILGSPIIGSHIENVARTLGRPILVTPQEFVRPERFLIAYDGSPTSRKCVDMIAASPLLKGLECHLLMVGQTTDEATAHLVDAENTLASATFQVISQIQPGDPEVEILEYCGKHQMHLLAMGAYGHSRIRQFLVGSTTTNILARATLPLLLLR